MDINAQELRIGNLVSRLDLGDHSLRVESVLELRKDKVLTTGPISVICLYSEIKPIPLTEEWLLKFAFETDYEQIYFQKDECYIKNDNGCLKWVSADTCITISDNPVKYVHQLQNLYFCITGKELTI